MMPLNTAVVGLGVVSETHLSGTEENPQTLLAAVCDVDADRTRTVADEYGVPGYTDVDELISSESLDWVHICTPVQTHVDLAREFAEAGIPVLIEKPIAETVEEVAKLEKLSEDHSVPITSVQNHVFDPAVRTLREKISSGEIGDRLGVDTIYVGETFPDEANRGTWVFDLPGGEFEEGLPHPIYLTLSTGGWPRSEETIDARTALAREYGTAVQYDGAQIQYVTDQEVLCSIKMLSGSTPTRRVYVHGTEGSLMADLVSQTVVPVERDYTVSSPARARYNVDQSIARMRGTTENALLVAKQQLDGGWEAMKAGTPHFEQFDREARAIQNGSEMPIPLEQSRWTIEVMEKIRSSC